MSQIRIKFFLLFMSLFLVSGCVKKVTLIPDGSWHNVWSANRPDVEVDLDIKKKVGCDSKKEDTPRTYIRIIRSSHFLDLSKFPESKEESEAFYATTEHSGVPLRLLDSGPLDMSQDGSVYQIKLTKGMALISRSNEDCTYLSIKQLEKQGE